MAYNLVLRPEVEGDIEHAYNWYEEQKEGLGEEFLSELVIYYKKMEVVIYAVFHTSRNPKNKLKRR